MHKKFTFGLLGAIASAAITSGAMLIPACCAGPILFAALGVGAASLSSFESLFAYRWLLHGITLLFVAIAFQQTYLRSKLESCETHSRQLQTRKTLFWGAMILITILILIPIIRSA
jgi:hypothetical protein